MNESTTTEVQIDEYFTSETYTGYGMIKETNRLLKDLGIEKVLPGPMGYTYLKKGYVVEGVIDIKSCTGDQGKAWATKYIQKLVTKAVKVEESEEVEMTEPLFEVDEA